MAPTLGLDVYYGVRDVKWSMWSTSFTTSVNWNSGPLSSTPPTMWSLWVWGSSTYSTCELVDWSFQTHLPTPLMILGRRSDRQTRWQISLIIDDVISIDAKAPKKTIKITTFIKNFTHIPTLPSIDKTEGGGTVVYDGGRGGDDG
jgi:hypothetical protein